jgi:hypothetical protein
MMTHFSMAQARFITPLCEDYFQEIDPFSKENKLPSLNNDLFKGI